MTRQKQLWEHLARENSRYYINSDKGRKITEEEFRESGFNDTVEYIFKDPLLPGGRYLEIGCGTGRMTEFISYGVTWVYGTDISGEMIRQGKLRLKNIPNITLYETDGESVPLAYETVDVAFSYLVFQHMKSRDMVRFNFQEIYRVLKPGGIFKVRLRTDNPDNMDAWWNGVSFTEHSAKTLYDAIGFRLVKSEMVGNYGMWLWLKK